MCVAFEVQADFVLDRVNSGVTVNHMKFAVAILGLVVVSGCATTGTGSLTYETPGTCHFDHGTRYSVRSVDGDSKLVESSCLTTEQVLRGRI